MPMSDLQWNSITLEDDEKPRVQPEELREMAADLDPDDFDEPVQEFLDAVMNGEDAETLRQAATLLLQDEVDLAPDLASMGVEPDTGLIALLLAAGADVNARNAQGLTPLLALPYVHDLQIPQQHSCAPIIRLLAEAGADLNACDSDGYTRIELMLRRENLSLMDRECVQLLQRLGCAPRPEH